MAVELGLPLLPLDQADQVDLYADGADEVDPQGRLIKGRGAAMLREKILVHLSKHFLVLVDESKKVTQLGTRFPVPLEVTSMAWQLVRDAVQFWGGKTEVRMASGKDGPVITDQGNFVLDARFPAGTDLVAIGPQLDGLPGLVEHGLFLNYAHKTRIILGGADQAVIMDPEPS
jgi:ribose 5-phosphate isomerase A